MVFIVDDTTTAKIVVSQLIKIFASVDPNLQQDHLHVTAGERLE